jgi:hypothetical protein
MGSRSPSVTPHSAIQINMTLWWILAAIICAFVIGYILFAPSRKVARDEHIEPANMRPGDAAVDRMMDGRKSDVRMPLKDEHREDDRGRRVA